MFKPSVLAVLLAALVTMSHVLRLQAAPEPSPPQQPSDTPWLDDDAPLPLEAPQPRAVNAADEPPEPLEAPPVSSPTDKFVVLPIGPPDPDEPGLTIAAMRRVLARCLADTLARELRDAVDDETADEAAENPRSDEEEAVWRSMFGTLLPVAKPEDDADHDPAAAFVIDNLIPMDWLVWLNQTAARLELTLAAEGVKLESLAGEVNQLNCDTEDLICLLPSPKPDVDVAIPPVQATDVVLDDAWKWRETPCAHFADRWWGSEPPAMGPQPTAGELGTAGSRGLVSDEMHQWVLFGATREHPSSRAYLEFAIYRAPSRYTFGISDFGPPLRLRVPHEILVIWAQHEIRPRTRRDFDREARLTAKDVGFGGSLGGWGFRGR